MSMVWFVIGLALGCVFVWLQWVQVRNIIPDGAIPRGRFTLLYSLRLALFTVVTGLAMRESLVFGLVLFAGFWAARTLLVSLIGSGRISLTSRSDS